MAAGHTTSISLCRGSLKRSHSLHKAVKAELDDLRGTGIAFSGSDVLVSVDSGAWPPAPGATSANWQRFDENQFNDSTRPPLLYIFPLELSEIREVQVLPDDS